MAKEKKKKNSLLFIYRFSFCLFCCPEISDISALKEKMTVRKSTEYFYCRNENCDIWLRFESLEKETLKIKKVKC